MKSILSFERYDVLETIYRCNPNWNSESENVNPQFSLKINYKDEKRESALLLFSIFMGDKKLEDNSFFVKATIGGSFSLKINDEERDNNEMIEHMYQKNALSILYPYMRSLVSDLSSKGSEPPLVLPPINIAAMVDKKDVSIEEYVFETED